MTRHRAIVVRVLNWNLFHGRDHPPVARRPLFDEFAAYLGRADWDVALLQEAPPRWFRRLCLATQASGVKALTSRNQLAPLRAALADLRPDLMASGEGGSNQILVRPPWRIVESRRLTLARLPERRRMLWLRLEREDGAALCVATLHATAHRPQRAAVEVERAAQAALGWSAGAALVLGGDFNVRPREHPGLFARLRDELGLSDPSGPGDIDHVLARGLAAEQGPRARDRRVDGIELSDHAPVFARFVG